MKILGEFHVNGKKLENTKSIKVSSKNNGENVFKNNEIKGTIQFNSRFNKLDFLPNGYEVKRLLEIAKHTKKVRVKKKLYNRAYKLTEGLNLKVYE